MDSCSTSSCMIDITQHALKGQKLLAQGIALVFLCSQTWRPVRAKALHIATDLPFYYVYFKAFALTGRIAD